MSKVYRGRKKPRPQPKSKAPAPVAAAAAAMDSHAEPWPTALNARWLPSMQEWAHGLSDRISLLEATEARLRRLIRAMEDTNAALKGENERLRLMNKDLQHDQECDQDINRDFVAFINHIIANSPDGIRCAPDDMLQKLADYCPNIELTCSDDEQVPEPDEDSFLNQHMPHGGITIDEASDAVSGLLSLPERLEAARQEGRSTYPGRTIPPPPLTLTAKASRKGSPKLCESDDECDSDAGIGTSVDTRASPATVERVDDDGAKIAEDFEGIEDDSDDEDEDEDAEDSE